MRTNFWKRMSSGKYIDLNSMSSKDVSIVDINNSLNNTIRFDGHYKDRSPLTVAQHTGLCLELCEMIFPHNKEVYLATLLHDFGEAYYGDLSSPIKRMLGEPYRNLCSKIDEHIYKSFWVYEDLYPREEIETLVKVCDLLSLDIERRAMWSSQLGKDKWPEYFDIGLKLSSKVEMFERFKEKPFDLEAELNGCFDAKFL